MNVDIWQRWTVGTVTTRGVVAQMLTSDMGLGCVKTRRRAIAIEEVIRLKPF
jgi:hypothetical protein